MYVIKYNGYPKCLVTTEQEAQEITADLEWEEKLEGFNWLMNKINSMTISRAIEYTNGISWTYMKLEVL